MASENLYLKFEKDVEIMQDEVRIKDLGMIWAADHHILARVKSLRVYEFKEEKPKRKVISVLKIIEMISEVYPNLTITNLGEVNMLVERVSEKEKKNWAEWIKILFVCLTCFFGTAFTIMAFHNDIGINQIFEKIHDMVIGIPSDGFTILEISYSVGLGIGIIVFFNHIGGRRITKDPTPIEVEMRVYEKDVNDALIETSDREGTMLDVDE